MSTVSLSLLRARQGTSWVNSTNPVVMGYNNSSYYDQGVLYQLNVSVTSNYTVNKLIFYVGNISSAKNFANTNVYAVIYNYDPTNSFSNNTAPSNYTWRAYATAYINGDSGTANIALSTAVNITSSGTYYVFLTTDDNDYLTPYMRGSSNISCYLEEKQNSTPAASISISVTPYMDQQFQISWSPYTSGYTYTVRYSFVNHDSRTEVVTKTASSNTWCTIPSSVFGSTIPNSISGSLRIYVISYNSSGTEVGNVTYDTTLSIPTSNRNPTVYSGWASATYTAVASNCVAGYSDIKAAVNTGYIRCNYGATLKQINISCNSYNGVTTTSGTFTTGKAISGNNIVTITVYDSRNLSTTYTQTIVGKAYSPPSYNSLTVIRCNSSGTESSSGTYYAVTPAVSYTSLDGSNTLTVKTRWQKFGGTYSSYSTISNNVKSSAQGAGNITTDSSYLIEVYAVDTVGQSSTQTRTLTNTSVAATLNLKSNGLGAAFFGMSSKDKEVTVFGRVGVTPSVDGLKFDAGSEDGAMLLSVGGTDRGNCNGIFKGNGDGLSMGTSGICNIAIKSWYGIGFVDGCTGTGIAAGIDCRNGDIYARRDIRAGSWIYGNRLHIESTAGGNGVWRVGHGSSWINGRDAALVRNSTFDASAGAFWPVTSCKCANGSWDVGTLGDDYYFSYAADTDYTSGNNDTKRIVMSKYGDLYVPTTLSAPTVAGAYILAGDGGIFLNNLGASSGTAEPSGWWSGKLYFQYS